ncbi:MAG: hypothetical protein IV085_14245 [Thiobacillus sp.]|nr:hypothetical protein [Thiobacillus sp.]
MNHVIKLALTAAAISFLTGCGTGISGDYGGNDCLYQKISFKKDGTAYITMLGSEISAPYKVDGDKVSIIVQGTGIVFTKNGDVLEAGELLGQKMVCKKL